jgi:addiction module HigA family antidote
MASAVDVGLDSLHEPAETSHGSHRNENDTVINCEHLEPPGISQSAFAARLGVSFPRLNEIVSGKRGITPDTALRLERVLGMSADFWLGLQLDWDLWHAMHSKRAAAIKGLEPIRRAG